MSLNSHGLPSRVPVIAEIGRMLANPQVPGADKCQALQLLAQDHADLDEVEVQSALWAISQMSSQTDSLSEHALARAVLLDCAAAWLTGMDTAHLFLDSYQRLCGTQITADAQVAFARLHTLAVHDAELAARLGRFDVGGATA